MPKDKAEKKAEKKDEEKPKPSNSLPGTPFSAKSPQQPQPLTLLDTDILIAQGQQHTQNRTANKEYQELLKANCFLFAALTTQQQIMMANNLFHFLTSVRGRRFVQKDWRGMHWPFNYGVQQIGQEIQLDACKYAAAHQGHLKRLLGFDPPTELALAHRKSNDWELVASKERVGEVLSKEGAVNLIFLPERVTIEKAQSVEEPAGEKAEDGKKKAAEPVAAEEVEEPPKKVGKKAAAASPARKAPPAKGGKKAVEAAPTNNSRAARQRGGGTSAKAEKSPEPNSKQRRSKRSKA